MRKSAAATAVSMVAAAVLLLVAAGPSRAAVPTSPQAPSVAELIAQQLAAHPGGKVVGNTVVYADGSGFVASRSHKPSPLATCNSGDFCGWANTGWSGSMYFAHGTGTKAWSWTSRSYYNHRAQATRLYRNSGTLFTCYSPGHTTASAASAYQRPTKVYLSSTTKC